MIQKFQLCALLLILTSASAIAGQSADVPSRTVANTPVRLYPDAARAPFLVLPAGTSVVVIEVEQQWVVVRFADESGRLRSGYVRKEDIVQTEPPSIERPQAPVRPSGTASRIVDDDGSRSPDDTAENGSRASRAKSPGDALAPDGDESARVAAGSRRIGDLEGRIQVGTDLIVYDDLRREEHAKFVAATSEGLTVRRRDGNLTIPAKQIAQIVELRKDPLGRGFGIGFAVGGGLTLVAALGCSEINYDVGDCLLGGLLIYAAPAIAIGALIDYAVKEQVTIYESRTSGATRRMTVQPLLSRQGLGARVAWQF